jgi:multiple sugar transport system permease protein
VAITATKAPAGREASRRSRTRRNYLKVLVFLSPWVIGFGAFVVYPMFATLYYSFTHYDMLSPPQWVGLSNYRFMFTDDPYFWMSLRNTVWIIVVGVPVQILFAISTAFVLTRPKRGIGVYRTIFFVPTMVPAVAAALSFVFLLNPGGPIDTILRFLHAPSPLWFQNPAYSKPALVMLSMWGIGTTMIIFLSALLNVPAQLYEAADIEGAGPWQKFRNVTLPLISPVVFFSAVIGVIYGFQYFTEAYVAAASVGGTTSTGGPSLGFPQGSTLFYGIWLYQQGFESFHYGYASAMAWMLFLMIMVCTLILIRSSSRWVFYQGGFR